MDKKYGQQNNILLEKSDKMAYSVYHLTRKFPKEELFGLISQIRRSAISVPLNIVEGFARQGVKEHRHFLEIAYGSLKETKYILYFSYREKYIAEEEYDQVINLAEEVGKMLWSKIHTLKDKQQ